MKMQLGLILAIMVSAGVRAQVGTNTPVSDPPPDASAASPATNSAAARPAHKSARKKHAAKPAAEAQKPAHLEAVPLIVNQPASARQDHVNVRGQAAINSEIITRLKRGDTVLVLEEITLKHPKADEPAQWARITLPPGLHAWVSSSFLDASQNVKPAKLKVRAGPGENYSFIGLLHQGDVVKNLGAKGDWTEIEAPTNTYGFVAAHLLVPKPPEAAPAEVAATPVAPPVQAVVQPPQTAAPPPVTTPAANVPPPVVTPAPAPVAAVPVPTPLPPPVEEPPSKRMVQREGIVGGTASIQAPSYFELRSLDDGKTMDYLYTTTTNLNLKRYKGLTVLVTGEEGLDERWPNTPVLTVEKIQLGD